MIIPILLGLVLLYAIAMHSRSKDEKKFPPYVTNIGTIETIAAMAGPESPFFIHRGFLTFKHLQKWVFCLKFPEFLLRHKKFFAVADGEIARKIFLDTATTKSHTYEIFDNVFGPSIFSANGPRWKHARKGVSCAFSNRCLKRMERICIECVERWKEGTLEPLVRRGESFNIAEEMVRLSLSIVCEASFGYEISVEEMDIYVKNIEITMREFAFQKPHHKYFPFLFPEVKRAKIACEDMRLLHAKILNNYRSKKRIFEDEDHEESTIIECIDENPNYENDEERLADIGTFILAGYDTTAYSVAWTILEVARNNPTELAVFREKALKLSSEEWCQVDELQNIVKEAMRLNPVAALGSFRETGKDFSIDQNDGTSTIIPKGSVCIIPFYSIFRNPMYFDKPEEFLPGRWSMLESGEANVKKANKVFTPFAIGSRNCVGQSFAMMEVRRMVSNLLTQYDFFVEEEGTVDFFLTLKPTGTLLRARKLGL